LSHPILAAVHFLLAATKHGGQKDDGRSTRTKARDEEQESGHGRHPLNSRLARVARLFFGRGGVGRIACGAL